MASNLLIWLQFIYSVGKIHKVIQILKKNGYFCNINYKCIAITTLLTKVLSITYLTSKCTGALASLCFSWENRSNLQYQVRWLKSKEKQFSSSTHQISQQNTHLTGEKPRLAKKMFASKLMPHCLKYNWSKRFPSPKSCLLALVSLVQHEINNIYKYSLKS